MKLFFIKRENPLNRDVVKFYPHVVNEGVVQSVGTDTPKEFNTKMIRRVKLIFTPSVDFKKELSDVSFEVIRDNP